MRRPREDVAQTAWRTVGQALAQAARAVTGHPPSPRPGAVDAMPRVGTAWRKGTGSARAARKGASERCDHGRQRRGRGGPRRRGRGRRRRKGLTGASEALDKLTLSRLSGGHGRSKVGTLLLKGLGGSLDGSFPTVGCGGSGGLDTPRRRTLFAFGVVSGQGGAAVALSTDLGRLRFGGRGAASAGGGVSVATSLVPRGG